MHYQNRQGCIRNTSMLNSYNSYITVRRVFYNLYNYLLKSYSISSMKVISPKKVPTCQIIECR